MLTSNEKNKLAILAAAILGFVVGYVACLLPCSRDPANYPAKQWQIDELQLQVTELSEVVQRKADREPDQQINLDGTPHKP